MRETSAGRAPEYLLLGLLALLWGSSYLFTKVAVEEIPPLTLVAVRVLGAAAALAAVLAWRGGRLPRGRSVWARLGVQAFLNSIGAWTVLSWGQQYVAAGLASVLNSTAPLFVTLIGGLWLKDRDIGPRQALGALLGFAGVVLVVGIEALAGLGREVVGQLACLLGALMYAGAALYGRRFAALGALETALGTMLWASAVLVPVAVVVDAPWRLRPSIVALLAVAILAIGCTGAALLLYFRLLRTLGSLGVASQAYLRAGIGVLLGVVVLGETLTPAVAAGIVAAVGGVVLINAGTR